MHISKIISTKLNVIVSILWFNLTQTDGFVRVFLKKRPFSRQVLLDFVIVVYNRCNVFHLGYTCLLMSLVLVFVCLLL